MSFNPSLHIAVNLSYLGDSVDIPSSAEQPLIRLAGRLETARKRRRWTQQKMADLLGIGLNTYRRMESGSPGVSIGSWLHAFYLLGTLEEVDGLLLWDNDRLGAALARQKKAATRGKAESLDDIADRL